MEGEKMEMENELTLFDNEIAKTTEEKFTTRQLAEQLNMDVKTVRENGKKCFPGKVFENGKTTHWTKSEAAALIEFMKEHNNRTDLACTTVVQATTTELTPALKIKKAMELMREVRGRTRNPPREKCGAGGKNKQRRAESRLL